MRNEILEPNQIVLIRILSLMNLPQTHSGLLIKPASSIIYTTFDSGYQDWHIKLDSGITTIMRMKVGE